MTWFIRTPKLPQGLNELLFLCFFFNYVISRLINWLFDSAPIGLLQVTWPNMLTCLMKRYIWVFHYQINLLLMTFIINSLNVLGNLINAFCFVCFLFQLKSQWNNFLLMGLQIKKTNIQSSFTLVRTWLSYFFFDTFPPTFQNCIK